MGPRRWSRGREASRSSLATQRMACFNGATAMEPWKREHACVAAQVR